MIIEYDNTNTKLINFSTFNSNEIFKPKSNHVKETIL